MEQFNKWIPFVLIGWIMYTLFTTDKKVDVSGVSHGEEFLFPQPPSTGVGYPTGEGNGTINSFNFPQSTTPKSVTPEQVRYYTEVQKLNYPEYFSWIPTEVILGMVQTESSFRPIALGASGEIGLMQVKPETWKELGQLYPKEVQFYGDPNEWQHQIFMGMLYLYRVSVLSGTRDLNVVLTAYNVGVRGYAEGRRNDGYVQRVLGYAGVYWQPIVEQFSVNTLPSANTEGIVL